MSDPLQKVFEKLKDEGFRLTETRRALVKSILNLPGHWTIQDSATELKKEIPDLGVATVYRTVHLLAKLKLLTETQVGRGAARYEVAPKEHHDHLTCTQCGELFEFENDQIENLQAEVAKKLGFQLTDHRMELYGDCLKKNCPNLSQSPRRKSKR